MRRAIQLAFVMLLASCSNTSGGYPPAWGALQPVAEQACADIAGAYENRGEQSPQNPPDSSVLPATLAGLLFPALGDAAVDSVSFAQPDSETIDVSVSDGSGTPPRRTLSRRRGDYQCGSTHVILSAAAFQAGPESGTGVAAHTLYLAKSDTGSLLVYASKSFRGVGLLVVPYAHTETHWYRFRPLT